MNVRYLDGGKNRSIRGWSVQDAAGAHFSRPGVCAIMVRVSNLNGFQSVVFDMDGLLLDSERVALTTFIEACRELGFEPDVEVYYKCIGGNAARTRAILTQGFGDSFPFEAVDRLWHAKYHEESTTRPIPVKSGALELLNFLGIRDVRKAVVTSTRHDSARRMLANAGLAQFFEFVIGGDEIANSKPDPEIYLRACRRLESEPSVCLALEDSDNGVLSAHAAGMTVIHPPA
jgi:HAD superfamily hydrolase (TIGR01509 family)